MSNVQTILQNAQAAKSAMVLVSEEYRNNLLCSMANALQTSAPDILAANALDLKNAEGKISPVMLDRLRLTKERIDDMASGMLAVANLPSPLGAVEREYIHPNGLFIQKVRVPLGVVAIVYESRPNVTGDAAALCIKSGNVCVLRGGSDAILSNTAITNILRLTLSEHGLPQDAIQLVEDTTHQSVDELLRARGLVDLLIPRGGAGLIRAVVDGARGVPVIETGSGICHVYVDKSADFAMAADVIHNAKASRPSVCNSAEVCLVHKDIAPDFLPVLAQTVSQNVELRLDKESLNILGSGKPATDADFDTEFLDYIMAVKVVPSLEDAILHINTHGTHHSDAIITDDDMAASAFLQQVDSAAVYHNASTRFTDGGEFGLGCEMGISTQKIGARGPMGLYELTAYKYIAKGSGQIR